MRRGSAASARVSLPSARVSRLLSRPRKNAKGPIGPSSLSKICGQRGGQRGVWFHHIADRCLRTSWTAKLTRGCRDGPGTVRGGRDHTRGPQSERACPEPSHLTELDL